MSHCQVTNFCHSAIQLGTIISDTQTQKKDIRESKMYSYLKEKAEMPKNEILVQCELLPRRFYLLMYY